MEQINENLNFGNDVNSVEFADDKRNVFNALCSASKKLKKATNNLRHSLCITILFAALTTFCFFKFGIENPIGMTTNIATALMTVVSAILIMKFHATFSLQKHIYNIMYAGYITIFSEKGSEKEFLENVDKRLKMCSE